MIHILSIYYPHIIHYYPYMIHIWSIYYPHIIHILSIYYPYMIHILTRYYPHIIHYYPYIIHILTIYYPYIIHILSIYYPHIIHILSILILLDIPFVFFELLCNYRDWYQMIFGYIWRPWCFTFKVAVQRYYTCASHEAFQWPLQLI